MALQSIIQRINELNAESRKLLDSVKDQDVAAYLAELIPPGFYLTWDQYTPYFNDGEACVFNVYDPYLVKLGEPSEDDDEDDDVDPDDKGMDLATVIDRYGKPDVERSYEREDYSAAPLPPQPGDQPWQRRYPKTTHHYTERGFPAVNGWGKDKIEALYERVRGIADEVMEAAFGDHVRVAIRPDGTFFTNDRDHD